MKLWPLPDVGHYTCIMYLKCVSHVFKLNLCLMHDSLTMDKDYNNSKSKNEKNVLYLAVYKLVLNNGLKLACGYKCQSLMLYPLDINRRSI